MILSEQSGVRVIRLGGVVNEPRRVNLRDLGFVGTISEQARAEIRQAELRAQQVLTTAHHFTFGGCK